MNIDKPFMAEIYGLNSDLPSHYKRVPDCQNDAPEFTIFVIQNKQIYLSSETSKFFLTGTPKFKNAVFPQLVSVADEQGCAFIFSDVQKMSDADQSQSFKNSVSAAFLLDNIAEFVGERGQKSVFGDMDVKMLKEDYARCEKGDGYFYDIEADNLQKLKFIKFE